MTQLTDTYIVKDSNSSWDAGLNKNVRENIITMDDGFAIYADAFSSSFPTNNYTPQELGMKTEGTPFAQHGGIPQKAPHTYDSNQQFSTQIGGNSATNYPSPPATTPPKVTKEFSAEAQGAERNVGGQEIEPKQTVLSATISEFNEWTSNNVGSLFIGLLTAYGIYKIGVSKGSKPE